MHARTRVFAVLWAIAHLGHVVRKGSLQEPLAWALMASAILLLAAPSSRTRLAVLALVQLLFLGARMPHTDNHAYLMGFANLGLLAALALRRSDEPWLPIRYLTATFLLTYGAAAVAKLNAAFFDPASSCAVSMFYDAVAVSGLAPGALPPIEPALPFLIAGIELAVPVLLLVGRTRRAGIALAVGFQLLLSLSPTATALDFTLVVLALLYLFLPPSSAAGMSAAARLVPGGLPTHVAAFGLLAAFLALVRLTGWGGMSGNRGWVWLAATAVVIGGWLIRRAMTSTADGPGVQSPARVSKPAYVYGALVALQFMNISAPYLGIKDTGSFVMYSNLRTAGGFSNHFLLPRLPVRTGMDDLVEIVESSDEYLDKVAASGHLVTWHELQRRLSDDPDARITYRRAGELRVLESAREDPELVRRTVEHRFIGHRVYDPHDAGCQW